MKKYMLILGDIFSIALVTLIGFASHGEAGASFFPRMGAAFFPLLLSWFILAPALGLFQAQIVLEIKQLWRPVLGMVFAASFAVVLRGFILNAPVIPIFAVVLGLTSALGMIVWRGIYLYMNRRMAARV
ncbi:MAG: DUF3054 domain-containing protein [Bacteroidota bacterium]